MLPKETICCKETLLSIISSNQEKRIPADVLDLSVLVAELAAILAETKGSEGGIRVLHVNVDELAKTRGGDGVRREVITRG